MTAPEVQSDAVREIARLWNYDFYIAATLAPHAARESLIALAAYVGDLEHIRLTNTDANLAMIRVQWWRDEIQRIASGSTSAHPVAAALQTAIAQHKLPVGPLLGIADAIADQLADAEFHDDQAMTAFLNKRHASVFELAARCTGLDDPTTVTAAGQAYGAAHLCLEGHPDATARNLAERAIEAHNTARTRIRKHGKSARTALLPLALVPRYLNAAKTPDASAPSPLNRLLRLAMAHWFARL